MEGYVVQISGGNDKETFSMKQGVLTHGYVCLLLSKGHSCYRPRRTGGKKRKSVRGCTVAANISVLNLIIVEKGEKDIPGLTGTTVPHHLGPKRARRICKLFNLFKDDDVRQYAIRKALNKDKKPRTKAPKIQRLVIPRVLQHKHRRTALKKHDTKKNKEEAAENAKLLAKRMKEAKVKRQEQIAKRQRLSSLRASTSESESSQKGDFSKSNK
ncbi:likely cytosolic ribosomal protein s6 [Lynx pardinus]|nr:likely cytosolic ribosomal protein s6 [Lynx pardinus]